MKIVVKIAIFMEIVDAEGELGVDVGNKIGVLCF